MSEIPIKVGASLGVTINLGNYESLRLDFSADATKKLTPKQERIVKRRMMQLLRIIDETSQEVIREISKEIEFSKSSIFSYTANATKGKK